MDTKGVCSNSEFLDEVAEKEYSPRGKKLTKKKKGTMRRLQL